jgi:uncharacterized membrane protein YfcA
MLHTVQSLAAALPDPNSRRTRIWAMLVAGVIVLLGVQAMMPAWPILPIPQDVTATVALSVFIFALGCEYMDSSLGMGYGTTLTPLLLLAGFEPLQIVPAILLSELITGLAAGALHQRDGNVDFLRDARARRTALLLTALSIVGTLVAVGFALSISKFWLTVFISAIILAMGVLILATRKRQVTYRPASIVAVGAVAAFNKGLSGGGYGPLVTAGQMVSGLPAKHAVAIASVTESFTCAIGLAAYLAAGQPIHWGLAVPLALGAMLSVPMATVTVRRMKESALRTLVGLATIALGLVALAKVLQ